MKFDKKAVFIASAGALVIMTFISCLIGHFFPEIISVKYTKLLAGILFLVFGSKMLYDSYNVK